MGKFSRRQFGDSFLIFPRKLDLTFHANCLHEDNESICKKLQIRFSGKKVRNIFQNVVCWKFHLECSALNKFQIYLYCNSFVLQVVGGWVVRRCHVSFVTRGVQLILADSWARPAILVAGKGREVMFLFLLFLHFHSCISFFPVPPFHLFCYLFCLFSPFLLETTQNDPQGLTCR